MTDLEKQQQKEIERLQKKIKNLTEAYSNTVKELELQKNKAPARGKGRPSVEAETRAQVLSLCRQKQSIRAIAGQVGLATGTVHKIIAQAAKDARVIYVFMDREKPATIIDTCPLTEKVQIINLTDDLFSRAFGIRENPTWEAYEEFLESRCMPRTRYGIREELKLLGIDSYDPFQIVEKTKGRVYEDGQWLDRKDAAFGERLDAILKEVTKEEERRKRLLELIADSRTQNEDGRAPNGDERD